MSPTSDLRVKDAAEEMEHGALTPQEVMPAQIDKYICTHAHIYIYTLSVCENAAFSNTFPLPGNPYKSVIMHGLACFALLGLWYKKSVLMRHIYARKYKILISCIDQWKMSRLISIMKNNKHSSTEPCWSLLTTLPAATQASGTI